MRERYNELRVVDSISDNDGMGWEGMGWEGMMTRMMTRMITRMISRK